MPKNKRPVPRKSSETAEDKDETFTQSLCDLALDLAEQEDSASQSDVLRQKEIDFYKLVRKYVNQKKDEVLYDAIERAKFEDVGAYQLLRSAVEEAAGTVLIHRPDTPEMEINAFAIPFFVHSTGGLKEALGFQDQAAFESLVRSFQTAQLESSKAKVVLLSHAYDLSEFDSISYSHLNDMVRDAWVSMTDKRMPATPALERSMAGWSVTHFGAADNAVELRFLLGFAFKRTDDPFYVVPEEEAAADAYFAARSSRYQAWSSGAAPLLKRCLAPAGTPLELNFLYQDLFHGAKEQGMAEFFMLQMMADINQALAASALAPEQVTVIVAPADVRGSMVLRVNLYDAAAAVLASSEKPLDLAADLAEEVADIVDALATLGISAVSVALKFDAWGGALEAQPYQS